MIIIGKLHETRNSGGATDVAGDQSAKALAECRGVRYRGRLPDWHRATAILATKAPFEKAKISGNVLAHFRIDCCATCQQGQGSLVTFSNGQVEGRVPVLPK
jgi:hypothetical protein